jgi:predicted SnoaL-like aldol condensation-catalyzing enzyme
MSLHDTEANKRLVLEALVTLSNGRDDKATKRFWSAGYIQHSAHIAPEPKASSTGYTPKSDPPSLY